MSATILINNLAKMIVEKEKRFDDYKNNLTMKAEHNYLYQIDRLDKETFKENKIEIEDDKRRLNYLINELLNK